MKKGSAFLKKGNRILIISLIILILIATGLAVWVLINTINRETTNNNQKPSEDYIVIDDKESVLDDIRKKVGNLDEAEAEEFLEEKIEEYKNSNLNIEVRLIEASYLRDVNKYEEALAIMESLLKEDLEPRDKLSVLSTYSNIYRAMGDEEKAQEYFDKYKEEYLDYYDGGLGDE